MDETKKGVLLKLFLEVVRANLDRDQTRFDKAMTEAKANGYTDQDEQALEDFIKNPPEFKKVFGESAIPEDLQARMRDHDIMLECAHYTPDFKGFYPEPK